MQLWIEASRDPRCTVPLGGCHQTLRHTSEDLEDLVMRNALSRVRKEMRAVWQEEAVYCRNSLPSGIRVLPSESSEVFPRRQRKNRRFRALHQTNYP